MLYQVNLEPLGINGAIQIIDLLNDSGHYDALYEWHMTNIDQLCVHLKMLMKDARKKKLVDVIIGLSHIKIDPVKLVINDCLNRLTYGEFKAHVGAILVDRRALARIVDRSNHYIPEKALSTGMLRCYLERNSALAKFSTPVTIEAIRNEIHNVANSIFDQNTELENAAENIAIEGDTILWDEFEFGTNMVGRIGPSDEECIQYYIERYPWITNIRHFNVDEVGYQELTIPKSGLYKITAYGAGTTESYGAIISAVVKLDLLLQKFILQKSNFLSQIFFPWIHCLKPVFTNSVI